MKIVGISGRKQAGKNTTANIFHGLILEHYGMAQDWSINKSGGLNVLTKNHIGNLGWGEFDVSRKDRDFAEYANENMWPYVKLYSFADELKRMCTDLFEIPYECVWGTDEQKNMPQAHLLWENMPGVTTNPHMLTMGAVDMGCKTFGVIYHAPGPMTSREFMQFLGTEVMRNMFEPIWVNATINKIKAEGAGLAVIADVRFPNEATAIEEAGGLLLRLKRQPFGDDTHASECALDDFSFQYYIDNAKLCMEDFIVEARTFFYNHLASVK